MDVMKFVDCKWHILLCATVVYAARRPQPGSDLRQSNRLYAQVLSNQYNKDVRPVEDQAEKLTVRFSPSLIEILALETNTGHITMNMWIRTLWRDVSLTWNPEEYGGIRDIHVPARDVWLPDIVLYNGFDAKTNKDLDVVVASDGTVLWVAPTIYKMTCKHEFRGNIWICPMRFGSWSYDGSQLDIRPFAKTASIGTSDYISQDMWEVLDSNGERVDRKYECCAETYPAIEYVIRMRDKTIGSLSVF